MKIRGKLVCSFFIITVLPSILLFGTVHRVRQYQSQFIMEPDKETVESEVFENMDKELEAVYIVTKKDGGEIAMKAPLTTIEGYTEGILDGVAATPEKQEKYLRIIYQKAKEMAALVDELSLDAKIENGIVPYHIQNISVGDYFGDCVDELREELGEQGITLEYENKVALSECVQTDPEQLRRVINNIVGNSVKYFDKSKRKISIVIEDEENREEPWDYEEMEMSQLNDGRRQSHE